MSEQNKALMRRWFEEVWNKRRAAVIDEIAAPNAVIRGMQGQPMTPAEFKHLHANYLKAIPDFTFRLHDVIAEGDLVSVRWTATGTHTGEGLGFAATQRPVSMTGMSFARITNGRCVEAWNNVDELGMLEQVGLFKLQ